MFLNSIDAEALLENAHKHNPGKWREHSKKVAFAAKTIADRLPSLSSEKAYSLGLLHDIGRIKGVTHMKHVIDGYNYLLTLGYEENARVCLTHSFPVKLINSYSGINDCSLEEIKFIQNYLDTNDYNDYDRLIQLCDAIAMPDSICILEKRLIDVAIRNGINDYSIEKWKAFINIKKYFDEKLGFDLYNLFAL